MRVSSLFTPSRAGVLEALHARDQSERRRGVREASSLKALAPAVAELLFVLVLQQRARCIVEFGTSHGYSTLHLAAAAEQTGGHVYSVDVLREKTACARANLEAAELLPCVTLVTADGADFVETLGEGIDFVLVDYPVAEFARALEPLARRVAPGCTLFVDGGPDGYWETGEGLHFRRRLEQDPRLVVTRLPMHKEQLIGVWT